MIVYTICTREDKMIVYPKDMARFAFLDLEREVVVCRSLGGVSDHLEVGDFLFCGLRQ